MKDIAEWLASLELGEYAERFAENGVDLSVIRDLTENDLKELGVLLGHRRKMLRAIAELQDAPTSMAQTALEPAAQGALQHDLVALIEQFNRSGDGTMVVPSEYLEIVITRH